VDLGRRDSYQAGVEKSFLYCGCVGRFVALEVAAPSPKIAPQWSGKIWDDFVSREIRRTNRNLLIPGTALLTIVATVVSFTWREVYNYVFGPFPIQASELATIWNPDQPKRYYSCWTPPGFATRTVRWRRYSDF